MWMYRLPINDIVICIIIALIIALVFVPWITIDGRYYSNRVTITANTLWVVQKVTYINYTSYTNRLSLKDARDLVCGLDEVTSCNRINQTYSVSILCFALLLVAFISFVLALIMLNIRKYPVIIASVLFYFGTFISLACAFIYGFGINMDMIVIGQRYHVPLLFDAGYYIIIVTAAFSLWSATTLQYLLWANKKI